MPKFILIRFLEAIPVLFIVITITFFMVRLAPGGPFDREVEVPEAVKENMDKHYGLDKHPIVQYGRYLLGLTQGDFGPSFKYKSLSVTEIISQKIVVSLELGFYALTIALILGMTFGILASLKPNSWLDYTAMSSAMVGICLPTFVIGPLLILLFGIKLQWFNVSGWETPGDRVLPALTLGIYYAAYIARLTRGSMLEVNKLDYMRTARSKGLPQWRITLLHGFRNAVTPVINFLGPAAAGLISGSFVIETVFNIPGLGSDFVKSALNRDYFLILGTVIFYATLLITLNMIVDIIQVWLNPKQKFE